MLAVAGIVLVISMGWRFSGYLNQAAAGAMSQDVLFALMAFRLPGFLELIVPVSFFLAIMLAYGRFHVDSEMVVMESCGMSPRRLAAITLSIAGVVMVLTAGITLWLKPSGEREVEMLLQGQRNLTEFDTLAPGRFQTLRSGKRVTYVEEVKEDGEMLNVFINEYKETNFYGAKDVITIVSDHGETQIDERGNRFLVLNDGHRYSGQPGEKDYQIVEYREYGQLLEKENNNARELRRSGQPTSVLLASDHHKDIAELQWRISVILMIPVIALMAIPLSKVNPRQGRFTRLVPGMILCFFYVISLSSARSAIERENIPVEAGIYWVHLIFIFLTAALYRLDLFSIAVDRLIARVKSA